MSHVDSGAGVHFGPVKEAIERLLVFFAQSLRKGFNLSRSDRVVAPHQLRNRLGFDRMGKAVFRVLHSA